MQTTKFTTKPLFFDFKLKISIQNINKRINMLLSTHKLSCIVDKEDRIKRLASYSSGSQSALADYDKEDRIKRLASYSSGSQSALGSLLWGRYSPKQRMNYCIISYTFNPSTAPWEGGGMGVVNKKCFCNVMLMEGVGYHHEIFA